MEGIISCIRHRERGGIFVVSGIEGGFKSVEFRSNRSFSVGDSVRLDGIAELEPASGTDLAKSVEEALGKKISSIMRAEVYRKGVEPLDSITGRLWGRLESAARLFLRKLLLGVPIVIRFHNDADGSGGAYSLYLSIKELGERIGFAPNTMWMMNRGVAYSSAEAENDMLATNGYSAIEKPLLVIIDFGTAAESNSGISSAKGKFDIIWLDHHPMTEGFRGTELEHYINPWNFGGDSSYTAGFLASAFSKTFSAVDTEEYENASFIGDYSTYADTGARGNEASIIFDLVTSDVGMALGGGRMNVTPQEFEAIFANEKKRSELLRYANMRLGEVLDAGIESLRRYKGRDFEIFMLDFEDVRSDESKYPLPGRFSSKLLDRIVASGHGRVMVIVHVGAYLLMRLDKELCKDMSLLDIIAEVKERYGEGIEGGGGHRCAGTIKLRDKRNKRGVINSILGSLK